MYPSRSKEYQRNWAKEWRRKNPDKVFAINHSEANRLRQAKYRATHRKEIRLRNLAYNKKMIATNPHARILWLLRSRVNGAIKKCEGSKAYKTMELVGCSVQRLREHLEKQFSLGMTWRNHGKVWEIDHIIPVDHFDLTIPEEQKKAFHYTNTQPLNWQENRRKSNRTMI